MKQPFPALRFIDARSNFFSLSIPFVSLNSRQQLYAAYFNDLNETTLQLLLLKNTTPFRFLRFCQFLAESAKSGVMITTLGRTLCVRAMELCNLFSLLVYFSFCATLTNPKNGLLT
jgi:hypothetical protein